MRRVLCVLFLVALGNVSLSVQIPRGHTIDKNAYLQHGEAKLDKQKELGVHHGSTGQGELKSIPVDSTGDEITKENHAASHFEAKHGAAKISHHGSAHSIGGNVGEKYDHNDAAEEIEDDGGNQNTRHRTRRARGYYSRGSHSSESFEHGNRYGGFGGFGGFGGYQNGYRPSYPQFGGYNYGQGYYNRHSSESFEG